MFDHPLRSISALAPILAIVSAAGAATVPDQDLVDFEDGQQPFFLITANGLPPDASLTTTTAPAHVHDGQAALEYALDWRSDPLPALAQPALLTELEQGRIIVR